MVPKEPRTLYREQREVASRPQSDFERKTTFFYRSLCWDVYVVYVNPLLSILTSPVFSRRHPWSHRILLTLGPNGTVTS